MSSDGVTVSPSTANLVDPNRIVGDLESAKDAAITSLQESFHILGKFTADGASSAAQGNGLPELDQPTLSRQVNDLTLRIGLLQDALNQLMQQVSKQEIQQRMSEMQRENQKELDRFNEQMEKAAEAAEKNKEANKKSGVLEAISNWIQAVVSVVSAVFTLISAAAQILTNPVGAAGLIVAGVALIGAAAVQITLAIDATMRAAGQDGFLSDSDRAKMNKAVMILGYIALAGAMIGLVGGVVMALGQASKAAAQTATGQISRWAATKAVVQSANPAVKEAAKAAFKESMKPLTRLSIELGIAQGGIRGTSDIVVGREKLKVADLHQEASELQAEADQAEAAAKAVQAMIAKLRAMIEQLEQELGDMMEQGQQTLSIIFGAIDSSAKTMTEILRNAPA